MEQFGYAFAPTSDDATTRGAALAPWHGSPQRRLGMRLGTAAALIALASGSAPLVASAVLGHATWPFLAVGAGLVAAATAAAAVVARGTGRAYEARLDAVFAEALALKASEQDIDEQAQAAALVQLDLPARIEWLARRLRGHGRATRALSQERVQSMALLDRESERRVRFFANLSHELRTPLNAILGYSSLLIEESETRDGEWMSADLRRIQLSGRNLLAMIDDLLELSGLKNGRTGAESAPFDSMALLREVIAQAADESQATVDVDGDVPAGAWIMADRQRVRRCLRNLLDHAIERATGAEVSVRVATLPEYPDTITFEVQDRGAVLSPRETQELLQQSAGIVEDDAALGSFQPRLAVARSLARSLEGDVHFAAVPGGGLDRILTLPTNSAKARTNAMTDDSFATTSSAPDGAGTRDASGKVALIIDDDPAAVDLLSRWLRRCGYRTCVAYSGEAGLEIARNEAPDIVLLDALMPGRSGYDVLPEMRSDPRLADTPIVLVTVDDDRARGLDAGASDFVRKPVSETELRRLLAVYDQDMQGDILIIEDDDDAAEIMARNLRRLGFTTHRATDGVEGLEAMRNMAPKAIVLDLNMPRINGFEFIEQLAVANGGAPVPVVVVSGQSLTLVEHRKLLAAGCRFFLKGSSAPREIVATLREMVA